MGQHNQENKEIKINVAELIYRYCPTEVVVKGTWEHDSAEKREVLLKIQINDQEVGPAWERQSGARVGRDSRSCLD